MLRVTRIVGLTLVTCALTSGVAWGMVVVAPLEAQPTKPVDHYRFSAKCNQVTDKEFMRQVISQQPGETRIEFPTRLRDKEEPMKSLQGGPRILRTTIVLTTLLFLGAELAGSTGCGGGDSGSCNCSCEDEGKECAKTTEGRTGCGWNFQVIPCSPRGCCDYCCDRR
jgi:hypothetical protein